MPLGARIGAKVGTKIGTRVGLVGSAAVPDVPTVVGVGTFLGGITDQTPAPPAHVAADKLILAVEWGGATPVPAPTDWTQLVNSPQSQSTNTSLALFYRDAADASTPTPTVAVSGNNHIWTGIIAVRGAAAGVPEITAGTASGGVGLTTCTWLTVNTSGANRLILCFGTWSPDDAGPLASAFANAALADVVEVFDGGTTQGNGGGIYVGSGTKLAAGATGSMTCTIGVASLYGAITVGLAPA